jgi:NitT/TauT family transport system substrate-binding protein
MLVRCAYKNGDDMNKNFWKQFAIALALFLLGYFTFNNNLFS